MPDRDDGPVDGATTRLHAVPRDAVIALRGEIGCPMEFPQGIRQMLQLDFRETQAEMGFR